MTITDPPVTESPVERGGTAFDELIDSVRAEFDTQFTWDYGRGSHALSLDLGILGLFPVS